MQRSAELMTVGCFLSRFGAVGSDGKSVPPHEAAATTWADTYLCFYRSLSGGRSIRQFGHALKNTRDEFDGFFPNGRVGWRSTGAEREARPLTPDMQIVFDRCSELSRPDHWDLISGFHSLAWNRIDPSELDLSSHEGGGADEEDVTSRTEGGRKVVLSSRVERDPRLRAQAIRLHGAKCTACGFDFEAAYGEWGAGFCEVHHLSPLGKAENARLTNPLYDLAVVCANCHRMIHRRRGVTLSIAELRAKLDARGFQ
ncbi:HNH endonuclease [Sphingomonas sp. HITSZ_GF]|uniref:HNH endonuclease n=1 Tax=Sphingomonas sp. HITSZ_GF TaxID=3037247 RepID=UPI00240E31BE|nr:HNH endonuclease [Sphingomonas sp. HITSZ_GF]MDG2535249.1 HNH endonuclease [Sphingomonas sp. HITSZ_GF]